MTRASAPMSLGCAFCTISPPPDQANRNHRAGQLQDRRAVARLRCADAPPAMRIGKNGLSTVRAAGPVQDLDARQAAGRRDPNFDLAARGRTGHVEGEASILEWPR